MVQGRTEAAAWCHTAHSSKQQRQRKWSGQGLEKMEAQLVWEPQERPRLAQVRRMRRRRPAHMLICRTLPPL